MSGKIHNKLFVKNNFILLFIIVTIFYCVRAIDNGDKESPLIKSTKENDEKFREILKKLSEQNVENLLKYGGILRTNVLDVNGKVIYKEDEKLNKAKIKVKTYGEEKTLEKKKIDIFDIVPSVLANIGLNFISNKKLSSNKLGPEFNLKLLTIDIIDNSNFPLDSIKKIANNNIKNRKPDFSTYKNENAIVDEKKCINDECSTHHHLTGGSNNSDSDYSNSIDSHHPDNDDDTSEKKSHQIKNPSTKIKNSNINDKLKIYPEAIKAIKCEGEYCGNCVDNYCTNIECLNVKCNKNLNDNESCIGNECKVLDFIAKKRNNCQGSECLTINNKEDNDDFSPEISAKEIHGNKQQQQQVTGLDDHHFESTHSTSTKFKKNHKINEANFQPPTLMGKIINEPGDDKFESSSTSEENNNEDYVATRRFSTSLNSHNDDEKSLNNYSKNDNSIENKKQKTWEIIPVVMSSGGLKGRGNSNRDIDLTPESHKFFLHKPQVSSRHFTTPPATEKKNISKVSSQFNTIESNKVDEHIKALKKFKDQNFSTKDEEEERKKMKFLLDKNKIGFSSQNNSSPGFSNFKHKLLTKKSKSFYDKLLKESFKKLSDKAFEDYKNNFDKILNIDDYFVDDKIEDLNPTNRLFDIKLPSLMNFNLKFDENGGNNFRSEQQQPDGGNELKNGRELSGKSHLIEDKTEKTVNENNRYFVRTMTTTTDAPSKEIILSATVNSENTTTIKLPKVSSTTTELLRVSPTTTPKVLSVSTTSEVITEEKNNKTTEFDSLTNDNSTVESNQLETTLNYPDSLNFTNERSNSSDLTTLKQ